MERARPVAVDGFGGGGGEKLVIKLPDGLASAGAEEVKLPDGFDAGGAGEAKAVEGFAGAAKTPPPEGFGDSSSNQGLGGDAERGYIDQAYEDDGDAGGNERVDVGLWNAEADDDGSGVDRAEVDPGGDQGEGAKAAAPGSDNMEPGGYEEDGEGAAQADADAQDPDGGEGEEGAEEGEREQHQGRPAFTAQLKAAGYGGFHEWRLLLIKQMLESGKGANPRP